MTIAERRRSSASRRTPASDGSVVSSAARTGACRGKRAVASEMRSRITGRLPHGPPMTTSTGSASATTAARTPAMAWPSTRRVAAACRRPGHSTSPPGRGRGRREFAGRYPLPSRFRSAGARSRPPSASRCRSRRDLVAALPEALDQMNMGIDVRPVLRLPDCCRATAPRRRSLRAESHPVRGGLAWPPAPPDRRPDGDARPRGQLRSPASARHRLRHRIPAPAACSAVSPGNRAGGHRSRAIDDRGCCGVGRRPATPVLDRYRRAAALPRRLL